MHEEDIVHCDIKGDNILVAGDGTVRICDFEMSLDKNATLRASLVGGGVGGTLGFIAPEVQAWGNAGFPTEASKIPEDAAEPSAASDMYAFGVVVLNVLHPPTSSKHYPLTGYDHEGFPRDAVLDLEVKEWVEQLMDKQPANRPTAVNLNAKAYFERDKVAEQRSQEALAAAEKQVAEAASQMAAARAAAELAAGETAEAQRRAKEQIAAAMEAQSAAAEQERQARAEKAAMLGPLRATTRALDPGCDAWIKIEDRVQQSLPHHVVTALKRIDNNELLADFNLQKEIVAAKPANKALGGSTEHMANVRMAFHAMAGGTDELKKIYEAGREEGGFDPRLSRDKCAYGRGSYFAEHAIYPAYMFPCPTPAADDSVTLLVADVILGKTKDFGTQTDTTLKREPPIEGAARDVYDSVQGTENSFGIHGPPGLLHHPRLDARRYGKNPLGDEEYGRQYVVYNKAKAYPRYLVTIRPQKARGRGFLGLR
jgi:hypothetical protein